jgi:hypothetical protein
MQGGFAPGNLRYKDLAHISRAGNIHRRTALCAVCSSKVEVTVKYERSIRGIVAAEICEIQYYLRVVCQLETNKRAFSRISTGSGR